LLQGFFRHGKRGFEALILARRIGS